MDAKSYKIDVFPDPTKDIRKTIKEIYIPQIGICVNSEGGVFKCDGPREAVDGIYEKEEVIYLDVINLQQYVKYKEKVNKIIDKTFEER